MNDPSPFFTSILKTNKGFHNNVAKFLVDRLPLTFLLACNLHTMAAESASGDLGGASAYWMDDSIAGVACVDLIGKII